LVTAANTVQRSHTLAAQVLATAYDKQGQSGDAAWLAEFISDRRGWWETTEFSIKDCSTSSGFGLYLMYVFPAVRLALIAAGSVMG
jgi:hypothetical protein